MKCAVETGSARLSSEGISSRLPGSLPGCVGTGDLSVHSGGPPQVPTVPLGVWEAKRKALCRIAASRCPGRTESGLQHSPCQGTYLPRRFSTALKWAYQTIPGPTSRPGALGVSGHRLEIPILRLGLSPALGGQLFAIHPRDNRTVDVREVGG